MVKTRTGSGRDDGPFSGMSKEDIGRHKLSLSDQQWLGEQVHTKARRVQELHGWLGIPERSLRRFAQKVKEAAAFKPRGRSPLLDDESVAAIVEFTTLKRKGQKAKSKAAYAAEVHRQVDRTRVRRGNHCPSEKPPHKKTLFKLEKRLKIRTSETAQLSTVPRQRAGLDYRNPLVHAAALEVLMEGVQPSQNFNLDAVSYSLKDVNGAVVFIRDAGHTGPIERDGPPAGLPSGCKIVNCIAQSGHLGPQVLMFADETLAKDAFTPLVRLTGFGPTSELNQETYFTSAFNRTGVPEQWKTIFEDVIFPFIERMKQVDDLGDEDPALLTVDGEHNPVKGLFGMGDKYLREHRIRLLKGPASWSACFNACDAGRLHSNSKKQLKSITDDQAQFANSTAQQKLDKVFKDMLPTMTASKRERLVDGVLRLMHAYQKLPLVKTIQSSFMSCGMTAEPGSDRDILDRQLALSKAIISAADYDAMRIAFPALVETFRSHGEIREDEMTFLGVPLPPIPENLADSRTSARHERALENQLSVHLNHSESQHRANQKSQVKLNRSERAAQKKAQRKLKKEWADQLRDPDSEFRVAEAEQLIEIQEEEMDLLLARDAQYTLQSEWLVQQYLQTDALADWEAPRSLLTAPRRAARKKPAAGKENRPNLSTNPYAKQHLNTKSRGINKR